MAVSKDQIEAAITKYHETVAMVAQSREAIDHHFAMVREQIIQQIQEYNTEAESLGLPTFDEFPREWKPRA